MASQSSDKKRPGSADQGGASARGKALARRQGEDVAIVCGVSDDGQGIDVLRKRGERLEAGTVRRLEQGKPIHGEVVRLRPREHTPLICDVEVEMAGPNGHDAMTTSGPPQVATDTYRKNWDAVYGSRKPGSLLN